MQSGQKIGIFGGTNGVGKQCLIKALKDGHIVTLLARDSQKIKELLGHQNLIIYTGDVLDQQKVEQVVEGQNIIINSLGSKVLSGPGIDICSKGTQNIVNAMKLKKVEKIITCTSLGVGDSYQQCSMITKFFIWAVIKNAIADKNIQEQILCNSGLKSIIVRPAGLTDNPPTGNYRTMNISGGRISRADVADFMLKQIYDDSNIGKAISLAQ